MKKALSLLLALVLCLSLCACSEGAQSTADTYPAQNTDSLIEFENVVLVENDTVKIELVNFYAKDVQWSSGVQNEKHITVRTTNKSDHDIVLNPVDFYLGGEAVNVIMQTGSITLDPGKSGNYVFMIRYYTSPNETPLNSLEELYTLEGSFSGVNKYEDKNTNLTVNFNIRSAFDSATVTDDAGNNITSILISSKWNRKDDSGEIIATHTFAEDYTGVLEFTDGDRYDFTWSIDNNDIIEIVLIVDGRDAPGSYKFVNESGKYFIEMIDNSSFTYYAE